MAAVFETIAFAVPMQLIGVVDFGGATSSQRVGAFLAVAMGAAYALMMTFLADGVGKELKRRRYRHVLEQDTAEAEAEGWPRPATTMMDDRMLVAAAGALAVALFAAAVIRQAAIKILADAGQSHVTISWAIFLLLTAGVFTAVLAVAYWTTRPLAEENRRLRTAVAAVDTRLNAIRRECNGLLARIEHCRTRIETVEHCSAEEQMAQLRLAAAQIEHRRGANAHVHGSVADNAHVQDVIENPERHVRPLHRPSIADELRDRIQRTRNHVTASVPKQGEAA